MTTLCYAKKTCSIGIHVLLEEIGTPYDLKVVDFSKKEQKTPEYLALNPKGKVAALVRDDGRCGDGICGDRDVAGAWSTRKRT